MSTLAFNPNALRFRRPNTSTSPLSTTSHGSISSTASGLQVEDQWNSVFRNGLPTPPAPGAMTGFTVKSNLANGTGSQAYHLPKYSAQDHSTTGIPTNNRSFASSLGLEQLERPEQSQRNQRGNRDLGFAVKKGSSDMIASSFQIPESVNNSKGSIAEFAAEITCLFWFESAATLQYAEDLPSLSYIDRGLVSDVVPSIGFRKWVTTILTTTLVGKNVILLALLFIYRLKKFNPGVSGKKGSEFRLLTIALMLGNKFLDDNTYTNKTWAEVSGISVTEIHIMEVEFLSNMRYNLYVSESEWGRWKVKLGKFGAFFEIASKLPFTDAVKPSLPVTPVTQSFPNKLPSPPSTHHNPGYYSNLQPSNSSQSPLPNPLTTVPHLPRSPIRPQRDITFEHPVRKRSLDAITDMPSAKRIYNPDFSSSRSSITLTPETLAGTPNTLQIYPSESMNADSNFNSGQISNQRMPRLPMPKIQTTASQSSDLSGPQLGHMSFPGNRAMSTVYHAPSNSWSQPATPVTGLSFANMNLYSNPIPNLIDGSRTRSNFGSATASPIPMQSSVANPVRPGLSPSYFLTNRSSPYRPVRHVNTLLIPPPSASLNNAARAIGQDQMHYQPLSKTGTERRTGVVPYLYPETWVQTQNMTPPIPPSYEYRV